MYRRPVGRLRFWAKLRLESRVKMQAAVPTRIGSRVHLAGAGLRHAARAPVRSFRFRRCERSTAARSAYATDRFLPRYENACARAPSSHLDHAAVRLAEAS